GRGGYPAATSPYATSGLLGQVLGITGVGFLITALAAYLFRGISPMAGLIAFFAGFVVLMVMNGVRANPQVALLWFYAFTFLEGIGLAPTIARHVHVLHRLAALPRHRVRSADRLSARRIGLAVRALHARDDVRVAGARRVH